MTFWGGGQEGAGERRRAVEGSGGAEEARGWRLMEVTILMSVTSSCHDKPLWVKPVLSLAGALALLCLAAHSTSSSSPFLLKVLI